MSKIVFDKAGEHFFETGVSNGVLYVKNSGENSYGKGVAWNGLSSVTESPEGAEVSAIYADNIKYLNLMSAEDFKATIEAYTYPDEFGECDGSVDLVKGLKGFQQSRKKFGFCYQTKIGNDEDQDLGYKIHIIYNCLAAPSERAYETVNDSPEAITFSWEVSTTPEQIGDNYKPTARLEIDTTKFKTDKEKEALQKLLDALYGVDADAEHQIEAADPYLPLPAEVMALLTPKN